MTEKRFVYYEHKGADYILDTPNTELDFIEMLGDALETEEIVDTLNELAEENQQLKRENDILIKQRLGEERLKQEIADYHTSNGRLHRLNNELIRRLDEFNIDYFDILRDIE